MPRAAWFLFSVGENSHFTLLTSEKCAAHPSDLHFFLHMFLSNHGQEHYVNNQHHFSIRYIRPAAKLTLMLLLLLRLLRLLLIILIKSQVGLQNRINTIRIQ